MALLSKDVYCVRYTAENVFFPGRPRSSTRGNTVGRGCKGAMKWKVRKTKIALPLFQSWHLNVDDMIRLAFKAR